MTITISKSTLLSRLQNISKMIPSKPTLPQFGFFLFETSEGTLTVTGTNEAGMIESSIECIIDEPYKFMVPYNMMDCLKALPEQPIDICVDGQNITVKYHGGKFSVVGCDPSNYPVKKDLSKSNYIEFTASELYEGINNVIDFAANDDMRPIISCVNISRDHEDLTFVATSGSTMGIFQDFSKAGEPISVMISRSNASIIKSVIQPSEEKLILYIGQGWSKVESKYYTIYFRNIEGNFPNWRRVIPKDNDINLKINTYEFLSAIKRTSIFSSKSSGLVEMDVYYEKVVVSSKDYDYSSSAEETIESSSNNEIKIGIKGSNILSVLPNIHTDNTMISFKSPEKAILATPEKQDEGKCLTYLIMPLIINV